MKTPKHAHQGGKHGRDGPRAALTKMFRRALGITKSSPCEIEHRRMRRGVQVTDIEVDHACPDKFFRFIKIFEWEL